MKPQSNPIPHHNGTAPACEPTATFSPEAGEKSAPVRPGRRLTLDERLVERGKAAREALDEACPAGAPDERILNELAAEELPVVLLLHELEERLAMRMVLTIDDPRLALAVAKVLSETVALTSAMSKRIQATLSTAASLRAQRRFLALHGRTPESKK